MHACPEPARPICTVRSTLSRSPDVCVCLCIVHICAARSPDWRHAHCVAKQFPIGGLSDLRSLPGSGLTLASAYDSLWGGGYAGGFVWQASDYLSGHVNVDEAYARVTAHLGDHAFDWALCPPHPPSLPMPASPPMRSATQLSPCTALTETQDAETATPRTARRRASSAHNAEPGDGGVCDDASADCAGRMRTGRCDVAWFTHLCPRACGLCTSPPPPLFPPCQPPQPAAELAAEDLPEPSPEPAALLLPDTAEAVAEDDAAEVASPPLSSTQAAQHESASPLPPPLGSMPPPPSLQMVASQPTLALPVSGWRPTRAPPSAPAPHVVRSDEPEMLGEEARTPPLRGATTRGSGAQSAEPDRPRLYGQLESELTRWMNVHVDDVEVVGLFAVGLCVVVMIAWAFVRRCTSSCPLCLRRTSSRRRAAVELSVVPSASRGRAGGSRGSRGASRTSQYDRVRCGAAGVSDEDDEISARSCAAPPRARLRGDGDLD